MVNDKKGLVIGIDLGTTYSRVAVWQQQHNSVEIIHNDYSNNITPSCVAFGDQQRFIGDDAADQAAINPENTIFDVVAVEDCLKELNGIFERIMVVDKVRKRKRSS
ncbi:heat shock a protein 5 [Vigna unguiculata]|uniref:Heat shock a protein 5 n=1 Tax=Vigna unguiculata TaxID=3917 RepID=A0A4D6NGH2_VIGUN|nr:heat shock a protein 5 [Vigna unguiculata]